MKSLKVIVLLLVSCLPFQVKAIPEIPNPQLNDIAMIQYHPVYGAVIFYNPSICQQIGPACGFFRAHEYGHYVHHHQLMPPGAYAAVREAEADCWAASNGIPQEILAAYYLFMSGGSSPNVQVYGFPQQRAQRVRQCAIQAGKWIGP